MIIIGERINGMFKAVNAAIQERDKSAIQDLALNFNLAATDKRYLGDPEAVAKATQAVADQGKA